MNKDLYYNCDNLLIIKLKDTLFIKDLIKTIEDGFQKEIFFFSLQEK